MIEGLLELPGHLRQRLASALETGLLDLPCSAAALRAAAGIREGAEGAAESLAKLAATGMTAPAAGAWLRTLEAGLSGSGRGTPDLVWSGPEVPGLHARDTRRVYEELLSTAERSIWASTYAFFDGPAAFKILAQRMDRHPGLQVTLLLNIQRKRGDTSAPDALVRRFADRFWGVEWPGAARPRVFYDPRALSLEGPGGVLHAKAVVADEEAVFVTSANFTEAALDRNIELGLLVRDRALAASVVCHFRGLIDREMLGLLPGA